jgi:hypothetical protein
MYALRRGKAAKAAWYWVVSFSRDGKLRTKRFYDQRHGGDAAALAAAVAWRDAELAKAPPLSLAEFCSKPRGNNTSGVTGVFFVTPARQQDGVWQARLKLRGGPTEVKSFSVRKFGNAGAFQMAVRARAAMLKAAEGSPYVHDPVAKRFAAHDPDQRGRAHPEDGHGPSHSRR